MDPIDYSGAFASQSPMQAFGQGYGVGAAIRDDRQRQDALVAQQQAAQQQQQIIRDLLTKQNPTADDYANASILLPSSMREQVEQAWKMRNTAQQESAIKDLSQSYSAILSGRPDLAVQQLQTKADAMEKAGVDPAQVQALRTSAQGIQQNPRMGAVIIHGMLSYMPGGDKVLAGLSTAGQENRAQAQAPAALTSANAKAVTDQAQANVAPERAALEVRNLAEDAETKAAQREIARLDTQIKQANSETQRGELVLKRDELQQKLDEKKTAKAEAEQSKMDSIDRSLQTVDAIAKHPAITGFFFGPGTVAGKVSQYVPGSDRKDLQGLVDTLTSQQFLTSIKEMQGMGALSDAEGKRIASAVASLDLDQSAGAFKNALGVVRSTLEKARNKAVGSGNLPTTAGAGGFVMKHPQFGNVTENDINRLMASQPGATRQQVLDYLQSTGGK